jgi:tetratricopeptide (TPR) repeat protein
MSRVFSILTFLLAGGAALGQAGVDRPKLFSGPPLTAAEREQRESLYRYAYGLLCEHDDKLIEALHAFEESAKLDPRASEPLRAQAPILLMLDRPRDAVTAIEASLKLDPDDHMSWFLAARLHKGFGEMKEFRTCVEKGLANPDLISDDPALAQQLYLDLAHYLETSDAPLEAVAPYRSALKILDHPDLLQDHGPLIERKAIVAKAGEVYEKLGDLYARLKKYDDAVAAYRKSIERRPNEGARLGFHLAKIDIEQNKPAEALANLDLYLRLQPSSPEPYKLRIELLGKLDRKAEGLVWLDQASQADPLNINLKLLLASEYAAADSVPKAEAVYKALVADTPSEEAYRPYFKLLLDNDRTGNRQMLESFDAAIRIASAKPPVEGTARAAGQARAMLAVLRQEAPLGRAVVDAAYVPNYPIGNLDYRTRTFLATLADQHGRLEQAERFYKVALLDRDPENEAALYAGLFRVLWRRHKFAAISSECRDALQTARNTKPILFQTELAKALARQGRFDEASAAADQALQVAADTERMYVMHIKVRVLLQAAKYAEAEKIARKFLEEATLPDDSQEARYMLSGVYSAWKKLDKCEAELLAILKSDPTNATANNDLGYIWADHSKNLPEAEAMIRKAIDLDREQRKKPVGVLGGDVADKDKDKEKDNGAYIDNKDNAAYIDSLGWVLFRRGDVEGALKQLERAVSLPEGDDPSLWDHLGDVYFRLERYRQALTSWERSVDLYENEHTRPQDEHYRDVKRKLKTAKELVRVP